MAGRAITSEDVEEADPLREQLLHAAARVFASKGYSGTKIQDIVKAAGLSSGAVYTRFESKDELLMEAVVTYAARNARQGSSSYQQVADLLIAMAERQGPLSDPEAMQLEAYVAARREPEVAKAMAEARKHWRADLKPIVESAISDGTVSPESDIDSILYFVETMHLGLLLQRASGHRPRDKKAWNRFAEGLIHSLAENRGGSAKRGWKP